MTKFSDPKKRAYYEDFIIPEAISQISDLIQIDSMKYLPALDDLVDACTDDGNLEIPAKYRTEPTEADMLIFVGVVRSSDTFLAYSTFCLKGSFAFRRECSAHSTFQ